LDYRLLPLFGTDYSHFCRQITADFAAAQNYKSPNAPSSEATYTAILPKAQNYKSSKNAPSSEATYILVHYCTVQRLS